MVDRSQRHLEELEITEKHLRWLWEAELLDDTSYRRALAAIREGRSRALGRTISKAKNTSPDTSPSQSVVLPAKDETRRSTEADPLSAVIPEVALRASREDTAPPSADLAARPPRKSVGELFAGFMAAKNIRWGELVGGLLVVASSTALVMSFWAQIGASQLLKFFLFTAITAALFGAGLYTYHRWRIPLTSRGLLIISTMLVPLNFLALVAFSRSPAGNDAGMIAGELFAAVVFSLLVFRAARTFARPWPGLVTLGVVGASVLMLGVRRWASATSTPLSAYCLAAAPLTIYALTHAIALVGASRWRRVGALKARSLLSFHGVITFAVALSLLLLVVRLSPSGRSWQSFQTLSPLLSLFAAVPIAVGLFLDARLRRTLPLFAVVALTISLLGGLLHAIGVVLAWPRPAELIAASTISGVILLSAAIGGNRPWLHLAAAPFWITSFLLLVHSTYRQEPGTPGELFDALSSGASGNWLLIPVAAYATCSLIAAKRKARSLASGLAACAAFCFAVSMTLLTVHGFGVPGDPYAVTWTYAVGAAAAFGAAVLATSNVTATALTVASMVCLLGSLSQGILFALPTALQPLEPHGFTLLSFASAALIIGHLTHGHPRAALARCSPLCRVVASVAMIAAAAQLAISPAFEIVAWSIAAPHPMSLYASRLLWLAVILRGSARFDGSTPLRVVAHATLSLSAACAGAAAVAGSPQFQPLPDLMTVAACSLAVLVLQLIVSLYHFFVKPKELGVATLCRLTCGVAAFALIPVWVYTISVGSDGLGWTLWGVLTLTLAIQLASALTRPLFVALLMALWMLCPMLMISIAPGTTLYSMITLEWSLAVFFCALSGSLWILPKTFKSLLEARKARQPTQRWVPRFTRVFAALMGAAPVTVFVLAFTSPGSMQNLGSLPAGTLFDNLGLPLATALPLLAVAVFSMIQGVTLGSRLSTTAAAAFAALAATHLWLNLPPPPPDQSLALNVLRLNVAVFAAASLVTSSMLPSHRRSSSSSPVATDLATGLGCATLAATTGHVIHGAWSGLPHSASGALAWSTLGVTTALAVQTMLRRRTPLAAAALFAMPSLTLLLVLEQLHVSAAALRIVLPLGLATTTSLSLTLWQNRRVQRALGAWFARMHSQARDGRAESAIDDWLLGVHIALTGVTLMLGFAGMWTLAPEGSQLPVRLAIALSPLAPPLVFAVVDISRTCEPSTRQLALATFALTSVLFAWAWIEPPLAHLDLSHLLAAAVLPLSLVASLTSHLRVGVRGRWDVWRGDLSIVTVWCLMSAFLAVAAVCWFDFAGRSDGNTSPYSAAMQSVFLAGAAVLAICLFRFAVTPRLDPLDLPDRGKTSYVYLAEVLAALVFIHIRVTMPWLFSGFFSRYWPFIVLALAYAGAGIGSIFERQGRAVLAQPLLRTGLFLPVVALLGQWGFSSSAHPAMVFLLSSLFYGAAAAMRRSFSFGVVALFLVNGALWSYWHRIDGLRLWEHPQLWLIPPALSVLGACHLVRDRLLPAQVAMIRYGCLLFVYCSSTADILLSGVASTPWLPLLLAAWSVAGILGGILLKAHSFLFTGSAFFLVSLVTLIWHAASARGWTWLWYVGGICLGVAIIALFALFEKKRTDALRVIQEVKSWRA